MSGKRKKIWMWIAPGFMLINLSLYFIDDSAFEKFEKDYFLPITFILIFIISLFLGIVAFVSGKSSIKEIKKDYGEES